MKVLLLLVALFALAFAQPRVWNTCPGREPSKSELGCTHGQELDKSERWFSEAVLQSSNMKVLLLLVALFALAFAQPRVWNTCPGREPSKSELGCTHGQESSNMKVLLLLVALFALAFAQPRVWYTCPGREPSKSELGCTHGQESSNMKVLLLLVALFASASALYLHFTHDCPKPSLKERQCSGNLICASSIWQCLPGYPMPLPPRN
ncbi:hypothetical protein GE061_003984 [Apolygus lucorum]|uniref:Uncharacterized protein n=1 Tax=Apolygus lucorum TaxID=248454 RepID=A0A8S9WXX2_APOLU|nr:hypothetical protein GE061_003984 [Apolygus lucorum]